MKLKDCEMSKSPASPEFMLARTEEHIQKLHALSFTCEDKD